MKQRTIHILNGGLAIYFGIGMLISAIVGLVDIIFDVYMVITQQSEFKLWILLLLTVITVVSGLVAYVPLRVRWEELED